jgi:hypothetical protein
MLRFLAGAITFVVAGALLVVLAAYWRWIEAIGADIRALRASAARDVIVVSDATVASLPEPVRRYLAFSGVIGMPIPATVRIEQRGRIRSALDAGWTGFEAIEHYSTRPPAFVWKASFPGRRLPFVFGRDEYLAGEGSIRMKMLALFTVANEGGGELREAALMRYLNEMMWFPAAFAGSNVTWTAVDDTSAQVTLSDQDARATATMFFDADGRLTNFRASRFNTATRTMEIWETPIAAYSTFGMLRLPSRGSAVWKLASGDFAYIELDVTDIAYDAGENDS